MRMAALAFLAGTWWLQQQALLPAWRWSLLLVPLLVLFALTPAARSLPARVPIFALMGLLWASAWGHLALQGGLAPSLEGRDLLVEGQVIGVPVADGRGTRFRLRPLRLWLGAAGHEQRLPLPGDLLLAWYREAPLLQPGECWRLRVRLKRPSGFMNPGGFDYEGWLLREGIRARGYVREARAEDENRRLQAAAGRGVDRLRARLRAGIVTALDGHPQTALVTALVVGDRSMLSNDQWQTLTATGTNHLLAISGLHVGLVAGLAFFLGRWSWARSARLSLHLPAPKAGAVAALLAATAYAALAGFAVPTQRALVMVAVVMLALLLGRRSRPSSVLALALLLVLIIDPLAVLAPGFWLSFAAVAVILLGAAGRLGRRGWREGAWVQWRVTLGLLPLLALFFQQASVVAPLANLFAVPWVGLLTVPLSLIGSAGWLLSPHLGAPLLGLAADSLALLWWLLTALQAWPHAQWSLPAPAAWALVCAMFGVLWLLLPRGWPGRWLGLVWLLPLFVARAPALPPGQAEFTLLDVGQGLAAVVRTRGHTLVFDTGPRFPSGFDTGRAVVAPFLRQRGVERLDLLLVSHGDNDHRGGAASLAAAFPPTRVLSSVPQRLPGLAAEPCRAGEGWSWDGVRFELLHPSLAIGVGEGNNRSCVLRVSAGDQHLLLTGDIERPAEESLLRQRPADLRAELLVVPHHGSRSSSTAAFIDAVAPRYALFPVGYRNRYRLPAPAVIDEYAKRRIQRLDTARHGAIVFRLGTGDGPRLEATWRQTAARYWHRQPSLESSDKLLSLLQ